MGQAASAHLRQAPAVVGQRCRGTAQGLRRGEGRPPFGGQLLHGVPAVGQAGLQFFPGQPGENREFLQDQFDIHVAASFILSVIARQAVFRVITFTASGKIIEKPAVEETAARSSWQSIRRSASTVTASPTTISRA